MALAFEVLQRYIESFALRGSVMTSQAPTSEPRTRQSTSLLTVVLSKMLETGDPDAKHSEVARLDVRDNTKRPGP